ncbi:Multidrug resistance regulator 1 [Hyphodiscus hymeniophilus]|uniref:Multidrug resistance regulator 1 n=1 Tax=Hyphodiscus hymeniophilus TaxID=353542 RepID=A0A9P7AWV4_9HELO|nr:Multidrug resistance regulator 1 [Hyphodiscus hymeniophilus]
MEVKAEPEAKRVSRPRSPLKPPRKRKRIVISCTECHRRKQKCDRSFPCANCVARNKQSSCHYENESARKAQLLEESANGSSDDGATGPLGVIRLESESAAQVSAFGYAKSNGNNNTTLGIFRKIENYDADPTSMVSKYTTNGVDNSGIREKYKSLVRQLPSKPFVEKLLETFFKEVNNQYYSLDEDIFRDHLKNWNSLPFSTLNKGPLELSGDLQFFPALLFQCLALSLQFQPFEYDPSLDSLKYAAGMSFDDLANDYSESSVSLMTLLGKRHTTLITVQTGFLRTSFLKNTGMVPESWHSLSQTIRDAQEIGLHKRSIERRKAEETPGDALESLWNEQLRRRVWLIISLWDIHMALVLGRPATIDNRDGKPPFPIDAPIPKNRREVAPAPRTESDPPTSLSVLLWTCELFAPLWDIFNLEKEDPHQNDFAKVEKMHVLIKQISLHCPPYFRAQNPDTTWDDHPDCYWLPRARIAFQNNAAFTIMALHRPYIFTNSSSRTLALRAGLDILRAQRAYFDLITYTDYKMFSLVLNTFDAIILVAAIYILHPFENREDLDDALQHFEWAMERFHVMEDRHSMAKAALGVLKAIHVRLKKALIPTNVVSKPQAALISKSPDSVSTNTETYFTPPNRGTLSTPNQSVSGDSTNTSLNNSSYTQPTISNLTEPLPTPGWEAFSGNMSIPENFDFSSMAPLQPMHDLLYNDLSGIGDSQLVDPQLSGIGAGGMFDPNVASNGMWQFEGDFGNDSFWGFMNNYNP